MDTETMGYFAPLTRYDAVPDAADIIFRHGDENWSMARLAAGAERLAAGMLACGVRSGDRIALQMRSGPDIAIAYLACFRLGAIAAPINLRFKAAELAGALARLQPRLYIGEERSRAMLDAAECPQVPVERRFATDSGESRAARHWTALWRDRSDAPPPGCADPDAPALLLMTSGTTGVPKFVAHSLRSLSAMADAGAHLGCRPGMSHAFILPMVHASGLFAFLSALRLRVTLVTCDPADPADVLDTLERHDCHFTAALPGTVTALIDEQRRRPRTLPAFEFCLSAGDAPPAGQHEAFRAAFGRELRSFWAASEAIGPCTYGTRAGPLSRVGPAAEVRIVDDAGHDVGRGETGEMLVRGACVTRGYWEGPGRIRALDDGWYHTGDLMREESDGHLRFAGRLKDLIVRNGSNVSPIEVEQVIEAHPAIAEAGVVGVADPVLGERIVGFVKAAADAYPIDVNDVLAWVSPQLADYKLPERLFALSKLPRNALGKLDRVALRDLAAKLEGGAPPRSRRAAAGHGWRPGEIARLRHAS